MIEGFQHVGIGVTDMGRSYDFYKKTLGFSLKLNDHVTEMEEMVLVIGSLVKLRALMAANTMGGGVIELIQHVSSEPQPLPEKVRWGDLGYLATGVKAYQLESLVEKMKDAGAEFITPIVTTEVDQGGTWKSIYMRDPDGLPVELLETAELRASGVKPRVGGFSHVTIGVSDMDESLKFYREIVGYDVVVFDTTKTPSELEPVTGGKRSRTAMLKRSRMPKAKLPVEGGMIKLVQSRDFKGKPIFQDRRWGDVGIMEAAFEALDIEETYSSLLDNGAEPFCPPTHVDMGSGSVATFAYVKDPDGNTVEIVEVEKLGYLPPGVVAPLLSAVLKLRSRL